MTTKYSWEKLKALKSGTIIHDVYDEGLHFIVMRGPASLCGYIGIPNSHPLSGFDYDGLPSINVHGGLTFSRSGRKDMGNWPEDFYWYGWDYAHSGDYSFYDDDFPHSMSKDNKKWLLEDVLDDSWEALHDFKQLIKFTESIIAKEK